MELFLDNSTDSYFLHLIATYTRLVENNEVKVILISDQLEKLIQQNVIKLPSIPLMVTQEGYLTNIFTIAQYLCELSYTQDILCGKNNMETGEILSVFEMSRKLQDQALIDHYNKILEPKMFISTNHVTLADIYLFCKVYIQVTNFTDSDKVGKYIHFFRWFKHVQNLPGIKEFNTSNGLQIIPPVSPFYQPEQKGKQKQKKK